MPYSTLNDIKAQLPERAIIQLTDDEGLGSVNQTRVDDAISKADAVIDSYCGGRYKVPVTPTPELLTTLSVDIAIYNLYARTVSAMPEVRGERYRNSISQLKDIAKGLMSLGVATLPEPADQGSGAETNKAENTNVFSRDSLKGF